MPCKKVWYSYTSLEAHIKIHTRGKSYIYSICDRTFSQLGDLKYHQKRIITGGLMKAYTSTKIVYLSNIPVPSELKGKEIK